MTEMQQPKTPPQIEIVVIQSLTDMELSDLCDATQDTIKDSSSGFTIGFTRQQSPLREQLQAYWRGVLIVPERQLIIGKLDKVVAASIQLVSPAPSNQTSAFAASIENHFVAPWARGYGLARELLDAAEKKARQHGFKVLRLSVRATQQAAINLYETAGYVRWGTLEKYEMVGGEMIAGHFYYKDL